MLKYPTARLCMYNQLLEGQGDCTQKVLRVATGLGLIDQYSLNLLSIPTDIRQCGSLFAVRRILEQHIKERQQKLALTDSEASELVQRMWSAIEKQVAEYQKELAFKHKRTCSGANEVHECVRMAPVVMDFLLQELSAAT